jgi:hypothetical protein
LCLLASILAYRLIDISSTAFSWLLLLLLIHLCLLLSTFLYQLINNTRISPAAICYVCRLLSALVYRLIDISSTAFFFL